MTTAHIGHSGFVGSNLLAKLPYTALFRSAPIAELIMSIHPQVIEKNGVKEFVVLPYEEFLAIRDELDDYEDLKVLRREKSESAGQPSRPLDEILEEFER